MYLYVVAVVKDLLVANAGPLSLASFGCRWQGREERGEPPQQWGLGLFAPCYHLGFDVLFWMRKKTQVFPSVKNIQISLLTAQQRQVQDNGLQRQRFFSSPVTGTNHPCCSWRGEVLTGCLCSQKSNAHTMHPSRCTAAELPPDEIYTIYPKRQWSSPLGTWDLRPDFQQESAAPIALKCWDAITMPASYPYKIYHS